MSYILGLYNICLNVNQMCRHTTPMYRPPEILDTYLHLPINVLMDIWAFGCLLYVLKFGRHPFEDSAKLRIINCNYSIPPGPHESDPIVQIIKYSNSSSNRVLIDLLVFILI